MFDAGDVAAPLQKGSILVGFNLLGYHLVGPWGTAGHCKWLILSNSADLSVFISIQKLTNHAGMVLVKVGCSLDQLVARDDLHMASFAFKVLLTELSKLHEFIQRVLLQH